jgi:5-methylcytosine-specific restriction endonuclease McrA
MTRSKLVKKLDKLFSLYIRNRYSKNGKAKCFTCGKVDDIKRLHAGHFMSRKHHSTRWDEINVQVQCPKCNLFGQGEQYTFGKNLDKKYGKGTADKLQRKARKVVKLSTNDLKELIEKYK